MCVLTFMFPTGRRKFVRVARPTKRVEQACCIGMSEGGSGTVVWNTEIQEALFVFIKGSIIHFHVKQRRLFLFLVNETNSVHVLFLAYFVDIIYSLYKFRTSLGPSSGGAAVFMRHLVFFILYSWLSGMQEHMLLHTKCRINTVVPPNDGPGEDQNMYRL